MKDNTKYNNTLLVKHPNTIVNCIKRGCWNAKFGVAATTRFEWRQNL